MALLTSRSSAPPPESETPIIDPMLAINVFADLLPPELVEARRRKQQRNLIILAIVALVAGMFSWWGYAVYDTSKSEDVLTAANAKTVSLNSEIGTYKAASDAESGKAQVSRQVKELMSSYVEWATLADQLIQKSVEKGVALNSVSAGVNSKDMATGGAASAQDPLNTSGKALIGQLSVDGIGNSATNAVDFVNAVEKLPGITSGLITSVNGPPGTTRFSANFKLTEDMLTPYPVPGAK